MLDTKEGQSMKVVGVIPARYGSSRFPGKPLADICGKPMLWHVYSHMSELSSLDKLLVATDDNRIKDVCDAYSMECIMTSANHETGTDRVVEVSESVDADLYVVVMGDEPLIKSEDVQLLIDVAADTRSVAVMLTTKFSNAVDVINNTTIKMALNDDNHVIYMSRSPVPFPKTDARCDYYKNMGAYAFSKKALELYKNHKKGRLERMEDLEMLRLIEIHQIVRAVEVNSDSMSVDTEKDLERVRRLIQERADVCSFISRGGESLLN